MSKETLEAIDKAIAAHIADILDGVDTRPLVTGWVIACEVQTIEGGDVCWDNDYAVGETTSFNTSVGLAVWLSDNLRDIQATQGDD